MSDVIKLLPEHVANQIAAGEVVQRPASVVKELMENAIDAGATSIKLVVKDAGKSLIQVIDNGCGMSETDARMCFERHATSKISEARDLFAIRTMGFRGEAMASIAAVAQVEMRTRRRADELGTRIVVEDSTVKTQEACRTDAGTNISVKNLFFNVPARRNFLKADAVEMRHILEEFQRVAMANPDLFFSLHHNQQELFHLTAGNLRQRIVKIFGENVNKKLVPVEEDTGILKILGFVGKPDYFKRTRGEQYFFVNKRFIKSNYLHHAVVQAYDELLPTDAFPLYVLMLEIDPASIDINVHPTKQEIKFDDEKLVFNYLKVAVRHALGSNQVIPSLDFEQELAFSQTLTSASPEKNWEDDEKKHTATPSFSREKTTAPSQNYPANSRDTNNLRNWQKLYEGLELIENQPVSLDKSDTTDGENEDPQVITVSSRANQQDATPHIDDAAGTFSKEHKEPYQIHQQYIISQIKSGFILIDQQAASERILYEKYLQQLKNAQPSTQKLLFPKTIELSSADAKLMNDLLPQVQRLGFDIESFGANSFVVHGLPSELESGSTDERFFIEKLLMQYQENLDLELGIDENIARSMAKSAALRRPRTLTGREMQDLIDQLFACTVPFRSPSGRNCFITFDLDDLQKRFSN